MNIAVETEALVAGVVSPSGPEGRLLDAVVSERCTLLYDEEVLADYREALSASALELPAPAVEQFVDFLADAGLPVSSIDVRSPAGPRLLRVAGTGCAAALVCLQPLKYPENVRRTFSIVTARQFLDRLTG